MPKSVIGVLTCLFLIGVAACAAYVGTAKALQAYRWPLIKPPLELAVRQMDPLLAALAAYRDDHGHYPADLQELVPRYLQALPHLPPPLPRDVYYHVIGSGASQIFEIRTHLVGRYLPWWPVPIMVFTTLCYRSDEKYPDGLHREKLVDHVGRWAFYID